MNLYKIILSFLQVIPIRTIKLTIFRAQETVLRFASCASKSKTLSAERQENGRLFQRIGISMICLILLYSANTSQVFGMESEIPVNRLSSPHLLDKTLIAWNQVCTCRSYYGVPHTCYYSPSSDPDYSCVSKCLREANQ